MKRRHREERERIIKIAERCLHTHGILVSAEAPTIADDGDRWVVSFDRALPAGVVIDPSHVLVDIDKATHTPEVRAIC
jgi:hypothetical protein